MCKIVAREPLTIIRAIKEWQIFWYISSRLSRHTICKVFFVGIFSPLPTLNADSTSSTENYSVSNMVMSRNEKQQDGRAAWQVTLMSYDYPLCAIEILILWSRVLYLSSQLPQHHHHHHYQAAENDSGHKTKYLENDYFTLELARWRRKKANISEKKSEVECFRL